jgi:hypothetical protein
MKNITILALVLSLISVGPTNVYAQDATPEGKPPAQEASDTHNLDKASAGVSAEAGIIAVAVSVLGLIALAASSSSGDATPAATSHQP